MDNRLILVDGITGSGKSTTSQYLAFQLEKNNRKVKWYHEEESNHPLEYPYGDIDELATPAEVEHFMEITLKLWNKFVERVLESDQVHIVESYIYQDTMRILFQNNFSEQEIINFAQKIYEIIRPLNPALIYFYQQNVKKSIDRIWAKRGERWKTWFIQADSQTPYAISRGLEGELAAYQLWSEYQKLADQLVNIYPFSKLIIENSVGEWQDYRRQMIDFLDLQQYKIEQVHQDDLEKFCGCYQGEDLICNVYLEDGNLYYDFRWPKIRLLPIAENEFFVESFPIRLVFIENEQGIEKLFFDGAEIYGVKGKEIYRINRK